MNALICVYLLLLYIQSLSHNKCNFYGYITNICCLSSHLLLFYVINAYMHNTLVILFLDKD